ncbi:MAG: ParB/RepB/Spo0J family partition protein [Acidobacteria bacterium]|nr:ParB/RepB/Spo0J family partition protein [Holophagales bacterium]MYH24962.1 ParB/RepB/Spo0J family partition protein [Holophagales bacterium]MYK87443.1 ParB/RepB/Spo0J family partition protein [Acidobacteriota bacterium]
MSMAKIVQYRDVPLDDLTIGKAQARTSPSMADVDELASSIEKLGLLQPIVVCEAVEAGRWEILTGQRRFLAHRRLGRESIPAAILDERVPEAQAKAISITENLIRRKLSGRELVDGITHLYNHYGSQKAVVEATGLSAENVRSHIKYPRLKPELKELVDDGAVDVKVALKAQDASAGPDGQPVVADAVKLARAMGDMSGVQQKKLTKVRERVPEGSVDELIERAKSADRVTQVNATVTMDVHAALRRVAVDEGMNQDETAAMLIEEALTERGALGS